jgi:putative YhdH/YhfP family quinone oxidoreductase
MVVRKSEDGFTRCIEDRAIQDLPEKPVLVRVRYSSLNYKDALSATGNPGVTRRFPHTPGIDAAGQVVRDETGTFGAGDEVVVTGFDLGMNTPGGFGQYIRVPADWVMRRPAEIPLKEAMAYGTAGFTAALSIYRLQACGVRPEQGDILVTGSTGGVGSLAVGMLARAGYRAVAATGKADEAPYLTALGAAEVIGREDVTDDGTRAMLPSRWAGAVDTVGGPMLSAAIRATRYGGAVTCCGLAASHELPVTVYPFILRGVSLLGVDSANCPMDLRRSVWDRMTGAWRLDRLDSVTRDCGLADLDGEIIRILAGGQRGRVVVVHED